MSGADPGTRRGGRIKGIPNVKTRRLEEIAERLGVCPFEVLCLFAKGDYLALGYKEEKYVASVSQNGETIKYTIDPTVRAKCAAEAANYLYPKRKAIEISGNDGAPIEARVSLTLEDRIAMVKAARNSGK